MQTIPNVKVYSNRISLNDLLKLEGKYLPEDIGRAEKKLAKMIQKMEEKNSPKNFEWEDVDG